MTEADSSSEIGSVVPDAYQSRNQDDRKTWSALLVLASLRVLPVRVSQRLSAEADSACSVCETPAILLPVQHCGRLSAQHHSNPDGDSPHRCAPGAGWAVAHRLLYQTIHYSLMLVMWRSALG